MADENYYDSLRDSFEVKRADFSKALTELGFRNYESGSAFYIWTEIPKGFKDALKFNEMLMEKSGVGAVPGSGVCGW